MRDVQPIKSKTPPKGATALTGAQLRELLVKLRASAYCQDHDLADPMALFIATGLRRCELLAMRWVDFDAKACTLAVTGRVVGARAKDYGGSTKPRVQPVNGQFRCLGSRWKSCNSAVDYRSWAS